MKYLYLLIIGGLVWFMGQFFQEATNDMAFMETQAMYIFNHCSKFK